MILVDSSLASEAMTRSSAASAMTNYLVEMATISSVAAPVLTESSERRAMTTCSAVWVTIYCLAVTVMITLLAMKVIMSRWLNRFFLLDVKL